MKGVHNTSSNQSNRIQLRTSYDEKMELPQIQKNEIRYLDYIQVISSIVFAIVGIIMSCQSNSIYERQKEIQEKTISPAIDISVVLKDNSEEYATDIVDRFIVKNVGGIANYVDCSVRPFFLTHYSEFISGEETFTDGVIVPIISYTDGRATGTFLLP